MSHLSTKTRLLKEALNKKNVEMGEMEDNNRGMVEMIEDRTQNFDETKQKYEEEIDILKLKCEKYEIFLDKKEDKIDIETLDGRVTFLVNILEEYRKRLEEDVKREQEMGEDFSEQYENSLIDFEDKAIMKHLHKQNSF